MGWIQRNNGGVGDWIEDVGRGIDVGSSAINTGGQIVDLFNGSDSPGPISNPQQYQRFVPDSSPPTTPTTPQIDYKVGGAFGVNSQEEGVPWWVWVLGGAVVLGGVYYMTK